MPSEVVQDATPAEVTPEPGKGALGTWRFQFLGSSRTLSRGLLLLQSWGEPVGKPSEVGVYVGQHLSFAIDGKVHKGRSQGQNRTREIRLSGIVGGLAET